MSIVVVACSIFSLLSPNGWLAAVAFVAVLLLALQERMQPKRQPKVGYRKCRVASIPDGGATASLHVLRKAGRKKDSHTPFTDL